MNATTITHSELALPQLEPLYEAAGLPEFELPEALAIAHGGPLGFAEPRLYANFVASVDGVVAIPGQPGSSRMISAESVSDRFMMGCCAPAPTSSSSAPARCTTRPQVAGRPSTPSRQQRVCSTSCAVHGANRRSGHERS